MFGSSLRLPLKALDSEMNDLGVGKGSRTHLNHLYIDGHRGIL